MISIRSANNDGSSPRSGRRRFRWTITQTLETTERLWTWSDTCDITSYTDQTIITMPPIKHKALINVDLGEAYGNWACGPDEELIPLIDQANIACGFHASYVLSQAPAVDHPLITFSDPLIMMQTVALCKAHNVAIGAHPGLPDLQGFGRREMKLSQAELTAITIYQIGALQAFLDREKLPLHHVKPHGVLYGMMCRDYDVARAVWEGVPPGVPVFGLAGTEMERAAKDLGQVFWAEMYGDVKYDKDGMLVIDRKKK